ncbi:MAG: small multi-drug export protein [Acidaminobacteraceae bacterium]
MNVFVQNKILSVFIMSIAPISELRGAIPLGISLGMTPEEAAIISIFGNAIIVPILLLIIKPLFDKFRAIKLFTSFVEKFESRAAKKVKSYRKFRLLGLYILVAVPLPTTGVYTGCVAATVMNIKFKNALIAIVAGVFTSGFIVYSLSTHAIRIFGI